MDIERLKELKAEFEKVRKYNDMHCISTVTEDDVLKLIDEAITNQPVTKSATSDIGETSDGYHTFNELYEHRTALFATLCNMRSDISWKSMKHSDGSMFDGMFIAGIETPDGQYTYHCEMKYWYMFAYTQEIEKAPAYDGHQPSDYPRLLGLSNNSLYHQYKQSTTSEEVAEAIERFQKRSNNARAIQDNGDFGCVDMETWEKYQRTIEDCDLAVTALQAYQPTSSKTEKDEPCWYCIGIESHGIVAVKSVKDEFDRELAAYDTPYNFCPNCGRKIKEEQP